DGGRGVISIMASSLSETGVPSSSWPATVTMSVWDRGAPVNEAVNVQVATAPTARVVPIKVGHVLLVTLGLAAPRLPYTLSLIELMVTGSPGWLVLVIWTVKVYAPPGSGRLVGLAVLTTVIAG